MYKYACLAFALAATLLCANAVAQDDTEKPAEAQGILQALGSDLRIAVFAGVMPSDEAYTIWESAESALSAEDPMSQDATDDAMGDREAMEIYSDALKDAVANNEMTEEEAVEAWNQAMVEVKTYYAEYERNNPDSKPPPGAWHRSLNRNGRMLITRLRTPDPGRIYILLRPEFHRRDVAYLQDQLELDRSIATIVETMVEDYNELHTEKADAFRKALSQSRRRGALDKVDGVLSRMQGIKVDRDQAAERIGVIQNEEKRQFMFDRLDNFEENLGNLRVALMDRREEILATGDVPSRASIQQMFNEFESFRTQQYDTVSGGLKALLPEEQSAQVAALLAELRLEQARIDATMGGMDVDLAAALREGMSDEAPEAETLALLEEANAKLSAAAKEWTNKTIRREERGLELDTAKMQSEASRIDKASQAYVSALSSELTANINLRNETQNAIDAIAEDLISRDQSVARRFLTSARQQGFKAQMRQRWCQQALRAAIELEDLEEDVLLDLIAIQEEIAPQIEQMREQAIQQRLQNEPRVARERIAKMRDPESRGPGMKAFDEPNAEAFQRLDEQTERQLIALLGKERFQTLPRRPGTRPQKGQSKDAKGGGKGKGATGAGKGSSGNTKGTSRDGRGRGKGGGKG